ncbi:hypothetical protein NA57DRAFT_30874 [Rhizodiscina lignyota]|uniref:Zn(2)-C6 fungal-type domain-containing protein n=1 Tax=Rhizodiscina lignyota TaxID=1504668 RepID=A0A9P4IRH1_9PEZI|nr:hypothetical protein NA57DRAFT_30874 [Rhizodiscina lignyota]
MTTLEGPRGRLRSHHACLNCRRKKTRCPGEKPACSSCVRLNQACSYASVARAPPGERSEDRLAHLEEKLDLILSGTGTSDRTPRPSHASRQEQPLGQNNDISPRSYPATPPEPNYSATRPFSLGFRSKHGSLRPSSSVIARAIELYFEYCHRQPIWCFNREEVEDHDRLADDLVCSILALTSRFWRERDQLQDYGDKARSLIMLHVANGTVELTTIESLCLLSFSFFIDADMHLGRFHLGLAFQLCRSAKLDLESTYVLQSPTTERKKRLFWSLQILEQSYGQQTGLLSISTEVWRPSHLCNDGGQKDLESRPPPLPLDNIGSTSTDPGIWSATVPLGWVWSRARTYVSNCARNQLKEPWRHDSMYATVLSDLLDTENMIPISHRYDSVKFYERKAEELKMNRAYWIPWLKSQFTYHAIHSVLNHPFLYIVAAQHNQNLGIPNTFWRKSSELVLLHATWIVRLIDMASDKQVRLIDPFFGHVAAIAATVHVYYCCATDPRLKYKSNIDFAKCRKFLKSFASFSHACEDLGQTLDKMTRIASGSQSTDIEDWVPSKIHLSIPLMWDILQFNCKSEPRDMPTGGLLHPSLVPPVTRKDKEENHTLEIIVATSPEVTVNTADGGQAVPTSSYRTTVASAPDASGTIPLPDVLVAPTDSLMLNTPWLWADPSQFDMGGMSYQDSEATVGDIGGSTWWDFGNL